MAAILIAIASARHEGCCGQLVKVSTFHRLETEAKQLKDQLERISQALQQRTATAEEASGKLELVHREADLKVHLPVFSHLSHSSLD